MPYGDRRLKQSASAPNGLWYTGKVADDESGLIYLGGAGMTRVLGAFSRWIPLVLPNRVFRALIGTRTGTIIRTSLSIRRATFRS